MFNRKDIGATLFTVALWIAGAQLFAASDRAPLIGEVEPTGYGCNLRGEEVEGFIFVASFASDPGYWMNINGKRISLKLENAGAYFPSQKGKSSTLRFNAAKLKVILKVRNVTDPEKEFIDGAEHNYEGTLRVISTTTDRTLKVFGTCGS